MILNEDKIVAFEQYYMALLKKGLEIVWQMTEITENLLKMDRITIAQAEKYYGSQTNRSQMIRFHGGKRMNQYIQLMTEKLGTDEINEGLIIPLQLCLLSKEEVADVLNKNVYEECRCENCNHKTGYMLMYKVLLVKNIFLDSIYPNKHNEMLCDTCQRSGLRSRKSTIIEIL